ncbi:hypothetical protein S40288_11266 [Stachybotrys chartarum IBT 40288]|nr:hypothetical protein S40288_11266 [Stachybotrys chartarum IBT 40288]
MGLARGPNPAAGGAACYCAGAGAGAIAPGTCGNQGTVGKQVAEVLAVVRCAVARPVKTKEYLSTSPFSLPHPSSYTFNPPLSSPSPLPSLLLFLIHSFPHPFRLLLTGDLQPSRIHEPGTWTEENSTRAPFSGGPPPLLVTDYKKERKRTRLSKGDKLEKGSESFEDLDWYFTLAPTYFLSNSFSSLSSLVLLIPSLRPTTSRSSRSPDLCDSEFLAPPARNSYPPCHATTNQEEFTLSLEFAFEPTRPSIALAVVGLLDTSSLCQLVP